MTTLRRLEITNSLITAIRRKRIDIAFRNTALSERTEYDISVDYETDQRAWFETMTRADLFRPTLYDAAYLELAQRRSLALVIPDRDLAKAASASGVCVMGLSD